MNASVRYPLARDRLSIEYLIEAIPAAILVARDYPAATQAHVYAGRLLGLLPALGRDLDHSGVVRWTPRPETACADDFVRLGAYRGAVAAWTRETPPALEAGRYQRLYGTAYVWSFNLALFEIAKVPNANV